MKRFRRRNIRRKELIAMVLTSFLLLSALTVTGLYIKNRNKTMENDGYYIDFDALEAEINSKIMQEENTDEQDYTGIEEEFDYSKKQAEAVQSDSIEKEIVDNEEVDVKLEEQIVVQENNEYEMLENSQPTVGETVIEEVVTNLPSLSFSEEETLAWPIVGNIIINYSMDKTIYFPTLDQYKYNPAIVVSATKGQQITAATEAVVTKIYKDNELGNVVEMDLGDGYTLLYGQVYDTAVSVGQYVTTGQLIAHAGEPTKYYSVEGCNVYIKLTKEGQPVNPMTCLE